MVFQFQFIKNSYATTFKSHIEKLNIIQEENKNSYFNADRMIQVTQQGYLTSRNNSMIDVLNKTMLSYV